MASLDEVFPTSYEGAAPCDGCGSRDCSEQAGRAFGRNPAAPAGPLVDLCRGCRQTALRVAGGRAAAEAVSLAVRLERAALDGVVAPPVEVLPGRPAWERLRAWLAWGTAVRDRRTAPGPAADQRAHDAYQNLIGEGR
jgi:hypothetical protein